jgi:hypothetical protein
MSAFGGKADTTDLHQIIVTDNAILACYLGY